MIDLIRTDKGETPALGVSVRVGIDYDDYDLLVFAHEIQRTDSELAEDIREWVHRETNWQHQMRQEEAT